MVAYPKKQTRIVILPSYTIVDASTAKDAIIHVVHPSSISRTYQLKCVSREQLDVWIEALTHATLAISARRRYWS